MDTVDTAAAMDMPVVMVATDTEGAGTEWAASASATSVMARNHPPRQMATVATAAAMASHMLPRR
jgi:hypothetical protein